MKTSMASNSPGHYSRSSPPGMALRHSSPTALPPVPPLDSISAGHAQSHATAQTTAPPLASDTLALLEVMPAAVVLIDPDWIFSHANQAAIDLLGVGSFLGSNIWERFPGNCDEPFHSHYRRTMEERIPTEFEAFNGEPLNRWYAVQARPFADGIIIFFSDITARRLAEIERDQTSAQLQQLLDVTTDGILTLNENYVVTFANPTAQHLLAPAGDLLGRPLSAAFPELLDNSSPWTQLSHRVMDEQVSGTIEAYHPAPLDRWFRVEAVPSDGGMTLFFRDVTADHEATAFLRQQETVLSFVQSAARVATLQCNLATGAITWGHGSVEVLGRPWADLPYIRHLVAVLHPDSIADLDHALARCLASPEVVVQDLQVLDPRGASCWVELRTVAIHTAGMPAQVRGVLLDITARKNDEQALATSEKRYRVLSDLNPQALWTGSPDGRVTYANQRFLDYLGIPSVDSDTWLRFFVPADRERVVAAWTQSIATGEEYSIDARLIRAEDFAERWWHLRALPVRDERGAPMQWLGVATDVHDQRSAADTLRRRQIETERQRAELESLYQNTPIALGLFDAVEFRYLRVNDELVRITGIPRESLLGRTHFEVTGLHEVRTFFRRVVAGEHIRNLILRDIEHATRPGLRRSFNVSYSPVYDRDGHVTAISLAALDITQQQRTEAALIQSEKLAAVGRLASSISHEINNPLEAVTNLLYLIAADTSVPADTHAFVRSAQSELARVSQIATQTLRFHRQAIRPTSVSPAQLIDAVLDLYQGRLSNSGIRVRAVYATAATVLCFENDIRQVLNNLIANSIDAMRTGGLLLARAHDAIDPSTGRPGIRLSIADTGHGMDEETRQRVFEPFFTTKDLNGTGLGLWISAGIIERHHGRLTVRSSQHPLHHGTVFSLFLPHPLTDQPPTPDPTAT